jgi:hypothetical protein
VTADRLLLDEMATALEAATTSNAVAQHGGVLWLSANAKPSPGSS